MRFIINSQLFLKHLSALSGVISNNNTVPIISCFHLHLEDNMLTIKATDLETTMVSRIELENARVDGIDSIAV
ncbi:MAG: DNA polymerase III subunit beta, partial [Bacteroidales bacterium]|nr:DNA polymerase III subunit beta [Bacteroidales bacterium]